MGYTLELVEADKYISLVLEGVMDRKDLEEVRSELKRSLTANHWYRLLIDATRINSLMSVVDNFDFTCEHQSLFPPGTRHAIIYSPEHYEGFRFIENVAQNRGVLMRLFTDRARAVNWLIGD
jgi:hypothetical protein